MSKKDSKKVLKPNVLVEPAKLDSVALSVEDAAVLKENEQNVLKAKLRLADVELTVAALNAEKVDLVALIKKEHEEFVSNARKFAVKHGINPDSDPKEEKWNLDTSTMVFNKL